MNRIDLSSLYLIGAELHPLTAVASGNTSLGTLFLTVLSARGAIDLLLSDSSPVKIDFSRLAAEKLKLEIEGILSQFYRNEDGTLSLKASFDTQIEGWKLFGLKSAIDAFEIVFKTEMQRSATYLVPRRGTFNLSDLVDRAEDTFPDDLKIWIVPKALEEYRAAGRCYAFGLFTASGYHCCRASEAMLRRYYRDFTNEDDGEVKTWGELIKKLEKITEPNKPDSKTISHINHLREHDRNPLSHVRADLNIADADVLLASSKVAISAMAMELRFKGFAPFL